MNLDNIYCGDIEADGLLDEGLSKIYVFSFGYKKDTEWKVGSTGSYEDMKRFFTNPSNVIAIHNGVRFDVPAIEKILGIRVVCEVVDTLSLSWYIDCGREWNTYGLEWYGESFGVPKPPIEDWKNLDYETARHRCSEDVKITIKLWEKLLTKLRLVYDNDEDIVRVIKYLNFIMECSRHQEEQKIQIDIEKVKENLAYFESLKNEKVEQLKLAMPKLPRKRTVSKPKVLFKKDGGLSAAGQRWMEIGGTPEIEQIEIVDGYEEPNPNSVPQKKAWLYSLGWEPQTFKYDRNKETREVRKIEQILTEEKELCPSVLKLKEKEPAIEVLDGISVLTHRIGILKSLLEKNKDGFVVQGLVQLAVTLRWQHSVVVNFPKVTGKGDIRDGKWIRECLIAGEGKKIVQSDLSGIEDRTSDHYTYPLNPELVKRKQQPFYDPHTEMGVEARLMTKEEEVWFKWKKENKDRKERGEPELGVETFGSLSSFFNVSDEKELMNRLKGVRSKAKTTNYACKYLVSAPTLSRSLGVSKGEAEKLINSYWRINYAIKEITKTFKIKKVGEELWIQNPMSKFMYNLRHEKDAFSVVNQSSAVFCFNMWLYNITREGYWPIAQSHDDALFRCNKGEENKLKEIISKAMNKLNRQLKLNVELACETQIGDNVSQTH